MEIIVGSKNNAKVEAVRSFFAARGAFVLQVRSVAAASAVADQPMTLEETIRGARNRAQHAHLCAPASDLAIGIEGGLTPVPYTYTGYMNICAAVVSDGELFFTGLSSGFEHPASAINCVIKENLEIRDAYLKAGLEKDPDFSTHAGAVGFMTEGQLSRTEYCLQALQMAFAAYSRRTYLEVS